MRWHICWSCCCCSCCCYCCCCLVGRLLLCWQWIACASDIPVRKSSGDNKSHGNGGDAATDLYDIFEIVDIVPLRLDQFHDDAIDVRGGRAVDYGRRSLNHGRRLGWNSGSNYVIWSWQVLCVYLFVSFTLSLCFWRQERRFTDECGRGERMQRLSKRVWSE